MQCIITNWANRTSRWWTKAYTRNRPVWAHRLGPCRRPAHVNRLPRAMRQCRIWIKSQWLRINEKCRPSMEWTCRTAWIAYHRIAALHRVNRLPRPMASNTWRSHRNWCIPLMRSFTKTKNRSRFHRCVRCSVATAAIWRSRREATRVANIAPFTSTMTTLPRAIAAKVIQCENRRFDTRTSKMGTCRRAVDAPWSTAPWTNITKCLWDWWKREPNCPPPLKKGEQWFIRLLFFFSSNEEAKIDSREMLRAALGISHLSNAFQEYWNRFQFWTKNRLNSPPTIDSMSFENTFSFIETSCASTEHTNPIELRLCHRHTQAHQKENINHMLNASMRQYAWIDGVRRYIEQIERTQLRYGSY